MSRYNWQSLNDWCMGLNTNRRACLPRPTDSVGNPHKKRSGATTSIIISPSMAQFIDDPFLTDFGDPFASKRNVLAHDADDFFHCKRPEKIDRNDIGDLNLFGSVSPTERFQPNSRANLIRSVSKLLGKDLRLTENDLFDEGLKQGTKDVFESCFSGLIEDFDFTTASNTFHQSSPVQASELSTARGDQHVDEENYKATEQSLVKSLLNLLANIADKDDRDIHKDELSTLQKEIRHLTKLRYKNAAKNKSPNSLPEATNATKESISCSTHESGKVDRISHSQRRDSFVNLSSQTERQKHRSVSRSCNRSARLRSVERTKRTSSKQSPTSTRADKSSGTRLSGYFNNSSDAEPQGARCDARSLPGKHRNLASERDTTQANAMEMSTTTCCTKNVQRRMTMSSVSKQEVDGSKPHSSPRRSLAKCRNQAQSPFVRGANQQDIPDLAASEHSTQSKNRSVATATQHSHHRSVEESDTDGDDFIADETEYSDELHWFDLGEQSEPDTVRVSQSDFSRDSARGAGSRRRRHHRTTQRSLRHSLPRAS
jgi:hypothetical protein